MRTRLGWSLLLAAAATAASSCGVPSVDVPSGATSRPPVATATPTAGMPLRFERATIAGVTDGDSIHARLEDGRQVTLRLIGVDAPDAGHPFTGKAKAFTESKLPVGRSVFLEQGVLRWDDKDRYLVYLWLDLPGADHAKDAPQEMLNAMLVANGLAHTEDGAPNLEYSELLHSLEAAAKRAGLGIWS